MSRDSWMPVNVSAAHASDVVATPPGPPATMNTGSDSGVADRAGMTATRRSIVRPTGVAGSSGTVR